MGSPCARRQPSCIAMPAENTSPVNRSASTGSAIDVTPASSGYTRSEKPSRMPHSSWMSVGR